MTQQSGQKPEISPQQLFVEDIIAGQPAAYEKLVRENQGWMRALARSFLKDHHLAEDCVQESFILAIRKIDSFEGRSNIATWLRKIVTNNCLAKIRIKKSHGEQFIDDLMPLFDSNHCRIERQWVHSDSPEKILQINQSIELATSKVNSLPEDYRVIFILRDIEQYSTREAATMLQCSEGTVKIRLHRARNALKKLLEPIMRGEETP